MNDWLNELEFKSGSVWHHSLNIRLIGYTRMYISILNELFPLKTMQHKPDSIDIPSFLFSATPDFSLAHLIQTLVYEVSRESGKCK